MTYQSTTHAETGKALHLMWTGREMRISCDFRAPYNRRNTTVDSDYLVTLKDNLIRSRELARKHLGTQQRKQTEYYGRSVHGNPLEVGDRVHLHNEVLAPGVSAKLSRRWKGPHVVQEGLSDVLYEKSNQQQPTESTVVHFSQLKPAPEENSRQDTQTHTDVPDVNGEAKITERGGTARYPIGSS